VVVLQLEQLGPERLHRFGVCEQLGLLHPLVEPVGLRVLARLKVKLGFGFGRGGGLVDDFGVQHHTQGAQNGFGFTRAGRPLDKRDPRHLERTAQTLDLRLVLHLLQVAFELLGYFEEVFGLRNEVLGLADLVLQDLVVCVE